jgi:hypothetical protein
VEHSVYICGWSQSSEGFSLWTTTEPRVRSEAPTYPLAEERLLEAIRERSGAMQAVLEYFPPLPKSAQESKYSHPEIYLICGDDRFETDAPRVAAFETEEQREDRLAWLDTFFVRPVCRRCSAASSARSERPLRLTYAPRQYDGAFGHVGSDGATNAEILSQEFLALLSSQERQGLVTRPVARRGKSRGFYELLGPAGPEFVAVAGLPVRGWRCSGCGRLTWGYWLDGVSAHSFVAASDLPRPLPGIFTIGRPPEVHLCATGERWRELVGKSGVRGFVSSPLGVVPDREVVRRPDLPSCEERVAEDRRTSRSS